MNMKVQVDTLQLYGTVRESALARFADQLRAWDIATPPIEPLVLDFGLGQFDQFGLIESWIANEVEAGYCGKYLFVFDRQHCPTHSHRQKHETFYVVRGQVDLTVDGGSRRMKPGDVLAMPPGVKHGFAGASGNALLLEVSTPCLPEDNYFQDPRVDAWLKRATGRS